MNGVRETLERRIRSDLEEQIRAGVWKPGDRLPTEAALTAQYGCARMTVNRAMGRLGAAGLVVRNKRAGTVVARPHLQTTVLEIPDIGSLILSRGESYEYRLLDRRVRKVLVDDPNEQLLGSAYRALVLLGLHYADETPFALEHRVLNLDTVPEAEGVAFTGHAPGSWLLGHVPWSDARHRVTAVNADATAARLLSTSKGAACLQVERWTFRGGLGVTFARQQFPGDRYDLVANFAPDL